MVRRKPSLDTLGQLIIDKRGELGIRAAAKEIGISSSTLSRVENGFLPDLSNFKLICRWLDIDPNQLLGFESTKETGDQTTVATVHFKKKDTISPDTARSLSEMIMRVQLALQAEEGK